MPTNRTDRRPWLCSAVPPTGKEVLVARREAGEEKRLRVLATGKESLDVRAGEM